MSVIRNAIDKLKSGGGDWDYLEQKDGSKFFYRPEKDPHRSFFFYYLDSLEKDVVKGPRRPVPPLIKAVANAADRDAAMTKLFPEWRTTPPSCSFKLDRLVNDGVLEEDWFAWGAAETWDDE